MHPVPGTLQRRLHRVTCEWGRESREHQVAYPVFDAAYKVLGVLTYTTGEPPLWYPAVPATVEGRVLRFNSPYQESAPLPVTEMAADDPEGPPLAGCYLCDPWRVALAALTHFRPAEDWTLPTDLFERTIGREPIVDAVFEPPLHRLRGLVLRRGTLWRTHRLSILTIPPLAQALDPPGTGRKKTRRRGAGRNRHPGQVVT